MQLQVHNLATGKMTAIKQIRSPQHIESHVTFQVIAGGSSLLVQDYALFHADTDTLESFGITPLDNWVLRHILGQVIVD